MKKILVISFILAAVLVACKSKKETASATPTEPKKLDCSGQSLSFAKDIKPILEANCTKCHNTNNKAGYNFLTIESTKKAALDAHLLGTINHAKGFDAMPAMAAKLDQALIDKIECWIVAGMKD